MDTHVVHGRRAQEDLGHRMEGMVGSRDHQEHTISGDQPPGRGCASGARIREIRRWPDLQSRASNDVVESEPRYVDRV